MKKKSSIIKLSIIGVVLILGIVLSFVSVNLFGFKDFKGFANAINFGQDLKSGVYAVFTADESDEKIDLDIRISKTRAKLQDLLADKGYTEASVVIEGNDSLRVVVPNFDKLDYENADSLFRLVIGTPAEMKFTDHSGNVLDITNDNIVEAVYSNADASSNSYYVTLTLNRAGTKIFNDAKEDGDVTISAIVNGSSKSITFVGAAQSGTKTTITGYLSSAEDAFYLPDRIVAGQFDVLLALSDTSSIEPVLGKNALLFGSLAILAGLICAFVFLILRYKLFGVVVSASVLIFSTIMLILFSVVPGLGITVSSGIGFILALVLLLETSIAFCERIKYEYKNGKSILASFYAGFKRTFRSSIDTHAVIGIAALAMYLFGTTAIKSFAAIFGIGAVLSFLTFFLIVKGLSRYVLAINYVNENLYALERGEEFANLGADETDAAILAEIESETNQANEGGSVNEAI